MPLRIARPFNTFGARQSSRAVIPTIIPQIAASNSEVLLGDTETTRDFTFVEDTCRGLLTIASMPRHHGEVFNIGTGHEISVAALFDTINELMALRGSCKMHPESAPLIVKCGAFGATTESCWLQQD